MASYKNIISWVDKWEGGTVYFASEGQLTNRGIQFNTFKLLAPSLLGIKNPTENDLRNITQTQWLKFIKYFWNVATFNNSIKDQNAANIMFQAFWGSGRSGIKEMQRTLGVTADGIVGMQTINAINSDKNAGKKLYNALISYYKRLAKQPRYAQFLKGWLNRMEDLPRSVQYAGLGLPIFLIVLGLYLRKKK